MPGPDLVHGRDLVLIDLPQLVDIVAIRRAARSCNGDVGTVFRWFVSPGLPDGVADPDRLVERLLDEAGLR